jgi:hypothetical protein
LTATTKGEALFAAFETVVDELTVVVLTERAVALDMVFLELLLAELSEPEISATDVVEGTELLGGTFGEVPLNAVPKKLVLFAIVVVGRAGLLGLAAWVLVALGMTPSGADTLGTLVEGLAAIVVGVKLCKGLILKVLPYKFMRSAPPQTSVELPLQGLSIVNYSSSRV